MALPISIGDAIEICKSIVAVYKYCRYAPSQMEDAVDKADYVATILEPIKSSGKQLAYLASANGERLNRLLKSEVLKLQKSLKRLKQVVLKWKKAWPRLGKRVMFLLFTLPEVTDLRNDLEARMTGIIRILDLANFAGRKTSSSELTALVATLRQLNLRPKSSVGKADPERKAVKEALKASGVAKGNALRLDAPKKAHLLQTLSDHGVSRAKSELVTQVFESESGRPDFAEPPISPKVARNAQPRREDLTPIRRQASPVHNQLHPNYRSLNPGCKILVVDSHNGHRSLIAHAYLEYYRAWVANNSGGWLFRRVTSAGLNIESEFRTSEAGRLRSDPEHFTQSGQASDQTVLDAITGQDDFFRTDDRPYEKASIIERIQEWRGRGLNSDSCIHYDYILTFEPAMVTALEQLQRRTLSLLPLNSEPVDDSAHRVGRIILLPGTTIATGRVAKDFVAPIGKAVAQFLENEFGYERPLHSIKGGGLRTSYMQVKLLAQVTRIEKEKANIERKSGCKLHLAHESESYGWVIAIIGVKETLGKAEEMVRQLRSSHALLAT